VNYLVGIARLILKPFLRERGTDSINTFVPNAATIAAIEEGRAGGLPRFATVEALLEDLNREDPR